MRSDVSHPIIDQSQIVDLSLEPSGLYGAGDDSFRANVLRPVLTKGGGKIRNSFSRRVIKFTDSNGRAGELEYLSYSAVKVRKFGNRFATDARIDYHARWDDRRIQKKICDLWSREDDVRRLFVIVGFDDAVDPFGKEFSRLAREIDWNSQEVLHARKSWADPRGRGIWSVVAVWEK